MIKEKLSPKNLKTSSPKSSSGAKRHKLPKSLLGSPKRLVTDREKERLSENDYLKKAINILSEEKNLLYEYKIMAVPKINQLEAQLEKTKNLYESEIAYMQEYINLLKSNNPGKSENLEEELKNEKARSLTFYRALMRKQAECDENQEENENIKRIEANLKKLSDENRRLKASEYEKNREIEELVARLKNEENKNNESQQSRKSYSSSVEGEKMKKLIEDLKNEVKNKMGECINQAVSNYNIFSCNINKIEEKIANLQKNQSNLLVLNEKLKISLKIIETSTKEKHDIEKKSEKEYIARLKEISNYEEEHQKQLKTIKNLSKELEQSKSNHEFKLRSILKENREIKEMLNKFDDICKENNTLKEKINHLHSALDNKEEKDKENEKEKINKLIHEKAQLVKKLQELNSKILDFEEKLKSAEKEKEETFLIISNREKIINELNEELLKINNSRENAHNSKIAELEDEKISLLSELNTLRQEIAAKIAEENRIEDKIEQKKHYFVIDTMDTSHLAVTIDENTTESELKNHKKEQLKIEMIMKAHEDMATLLFTTNEELVEKYREIDELKYQFAKESELKEKYLKDIDSLLVTNI